MSAAEPIVSESVWTADGEIGRAPVSYSAWKRTLDVVGAFSLLFFLAPLLLIVAALIKLDSRGPVFFRQRRTGLHGAPFLIFKFRSMTVMEDGGEVRQASRNDNRVTRVGGVLRRSSIDELPQLINVLKGEMSLVGPRPHAVAHDIRFAAMTTDYNRRFLARPGLTGLAQVNGFRGEIHTPEDIQRRTELDNRYVDIWSVGLDIGILFKTVAVVLFQRSAY